MKKLLSLALALVMVFSLAACGSKEDGNGFDPSALESKTTKYAGDYRVSSMMIGGQRYEYADLVAEGMADQVYLKINEDCTGVLNLGDGEVQIKIDDWNGISTLDGKDTLKFWEEGVTTLGIEDSESGVTIYFTTDPAPEVGEFPLSFIDTYGGDWIGQGKFMDCTGDFEGNNDSICHGLARLVFDDVGNCTIFAGLGIGSDEKNLRDLTVTYDADANDMILSDTFFGYPLTDESFVEYEEETGVLYLYAKAEKNTDSALAVAVCLRHQGDAWTGEELTTLDQQYADLYAGIAFEELVSGFGLDVSRLPSNTPSGSGSGTSTPAGPSKSYNTSGFDGKAKLYYEDLIVVDYPTAKFHDDGDAIGSDDPYLYIFAQTILAPNSSSVAGCEEDMGNYAKDSDYSSVTDENIMLGAHSARRVVAESSWMGNIAVYLIDLGADGNDNAGWAFINVKYEDASALETAEAILSTIRAK